MKRITIFYITSAIIIAILIVHSVLTIIAMIKATDLDDCNDATCISSGCTFRSCDKGTCKETPISGCCENGICDSQIQSSIWSASQIPYTLAMYSFDTNGPSVNYTFNIAYVNNITSSQINNSTVINVNNVGIQDGVILNGCLVSTGDCVNQIGSTEVENVYSVTLNYFDTNTTDTNSDNKYTSVGNDYLRIYENGSMQFMTGFTQVHTAQSTNEVCLYQIQSLIDNGTISINNLTFPSFGGILNVTDLFINGILFIGNITSNLNLTLNFNNTIEVSNLIIMNNTVQGDIPATNDTLLINPHGGNVGIGIDATNVNSTKLKYPLDVNGVIETSNGLMINNNSQSNTNFNYYENYIFQTQFEGPWFQLSPSQNIFISIFQNVVQMTFNNSYIDFCNGSLSIVQSMTTIPERFINTNSNIEQQVRVVDSSLNIIGRLIIDTIGHIKIGTYDPDMVFNGANSELCGFDATSVMWTI